MTGPAARLFAAGAVLAALAAGPTAAATAGDARHANGGDPVTTAAEATATAGDAQAAFSLGLLYDLGSVIQRDPVSALYWYKTAAEAGLPAGAFNVGAMYDSGQGVPQNTAEAAIWYSRAAAHGHHRAQFALGQLYEQGDGVPTNRDVAAAWFQAAADGGITAAVPRLKALKSVAANRPAGRVLPVMADSPPRNAALSLNGDNPVVEVVWIAPPQPQPVQYRVQVQEIGGSAPATVFTASVTGTSVPVPLPMKPDFYLWIVETVGQDGTSTLGEWSWFSVDTPGPILQSKATRPESLTAVH